MNEILQAIGLSPDEITVYEYLLTSGARTAGDVSRHTSIKRGTAYNVLGDLVARGFARQFEDKGVMKFALEHPSRIREIIESEKQKKEEAMHAFDSALPALTSRWNLVYHRPAVSYFEGKEGLKKIYEGIINDSFDEVLVIRSPFDAELLGQKYYDDYAKRRADRGMRTKIISSKIADARLLEQDKEFKRERHYWTDMDIPAEVDIWGNKVAIISLQNVLLGTVIENEAVASTFRKLFTQIWRGLGEPPAHQDDVPKPEPLV